MRVNFFDHVHVYAVNPDRTLDFYVTHFLAERVGSMDAGGGRRTHFLLLGGQLIAVSAFPVGMTPSEVPAAADGARTGGFGVAHIGLNVDGLDVAIASLSRDGVEILGTPKQTGMLKYCYLAAPDGVVIELTEYEIPAKLKPLVPVFRAYNKFVHVVRRRFVKAAFGKS